MANRTKHTPSSTCPGHPFDPTLCVACENDALTAENTMLREALEEIAGRGPIKGYGSPSAVLLRLVGTQSIARSALAKGD